MSVPISNPKGLGGYTDLATITVPITRNFIAAGTITALQAVFLGTNLRIVSAATDSTATKVIGIATKSGVSGDIIPVVVWGPVESVPISGDATAGAPLKRSVTTSGRVASTATPAVGEYLGFAVAAASAANGTVTVFVSAGGT